MNMVIVCEPPRETHPEAIKYLDPKFWEQWARRRPPEWVSAKRLSLSACYVSRLSALQGTSIICQYFHVQSCLPS